MSKEAPEAKEPVLYVDKVATAVPQWYAESKYEYDKPMRESYIDNALNPFVGAYSFYYIRQRVKRQQLEEAKVLEKKRQANIKAKRKAKDDAKRKLRSKLKYVP